MNIQHCFFRRWWVAAGLTAVALVLRLQRFASRDLWTDEVFQLQHLQGALKPFWDRATRYSDETSFPGEYLLNYFTVHLNGANKWVLLLPHFIVMLAGFFILYKICQRWFRSAVADAVVFSLIAFNADLIFHSLEFRPYAVLYVLCLGSLFCSMLIVEKYLLLRGWQKALIALFFFAAAVYHAYGVLYVFLPMIFIVLKDLGQSGCGYFKRPYAGFLAWVSVAACCGWLWYASFSAFGAGYFSFVESVEEWRARIFMYIPNPLVDPVGFFKAVFGNLVGYKFFYPFMALPLAALVFCFDQWRERVLFFLLLIILPILLILLMDVKGMYWFLQRQFIFVVPLFALWIGKSADDLVDLFKRQAKK